MEGPLVCSRCGEGMEDFEECEGFIICTKCGNAMTDTRMYTREAGTNGVVVDENDNGAIAAAGTMNRSTVPGKSAFYNSTTIEWHREHLAAAASALNLPVSVLDTAKGLVPQLMQWLTEDGTKRRGATPEHLAALLYLCARYDGSTLRLARVAEPFSCTPHRVARIYMRMLQGMHLTAPPPSLAALLLRFSSVLVPQLVGPFQGRLEHHPVTRTALEVGELMEALGEMEDRNRQPAAAALLKLSLAANGTAVSNEVLARLLGCGRTSVQIAGARFSQQLLRMARLLPFTRGLKAHEVAKHAHSLLRLHTMALRVQASERARDLDGGAEQPPPLLPAPAQGPATGP